MFLLDILSHRTSASMAIQHQLGSLGLVGLVLLASTDSRCWRTVISLALGQEGSRKG